VKAGGHLSEEDEIRLYERYGMSSGTTYTSRDAPGTAGPDTSGATTDDAMPRSEVRLLVGKETCETGRVRLRRYLVTEEAQRTVPAPTEKVRVEREPIT
jgi:stress response protein YsnF